MAIYLGQFCAQEEDAMEEQVNATISQHFSSLKDPRIQLKTRHKLIDIIIITICAVICGTDDWTEVVDYAKAKRDWLKMFLELPHPSVPI